MRTLGASLDSEFMWFNQSPVKTLPEWKRAWFTSAVFRKAVSGAIRREDMARIVFRGHAHPAVGPISAANRFWVNAALKPVAADTQAALKQLAGEGFALKDGVLRDKAGHAVEFSNNARNLWAMNAPAVDDKILVVKSKIVHRAEDMAAVGKIKPQFLVLGENSRFSWVIESFV